jgi:hypothetical protein
MGDADAECVVGDFIVLSPVSVVRIGTRGYVGCEVPACYDVVNLSVL